MLKHGLALLLAVAPVTAMGQRLDDPQLFEQRLAACDGCHGQQGIPQNLNQPVIWGQTTKYIDWRIGDFRKGIGGDPEMNAILSDLGRLDIVKLNDHYAQKPWPDLGQPAASPEAVAQAEALIARQNCHAAGCHNERFTGDDLRVAGQTKEYLQKALTDFRDKKRENFLMQPVTESLSDTDIEALATYLAALKQ